MNTNVTYLPNTSSHAWLCHFERDIGHAIGPHSYPLPSAKQAFSVRIEQLIGFSCEPRARFESSNSSIPVLTWSDYGVFAPMGPMPEHMTEELMRFSRHELLGIFVNTLLQRLFHLYYQSWAALRPEHQFMSDSGFNYLLQILNGHHHVKTVFHLGWLKPPLSKLPLYVSRYLGLRLYVTQSPCERIVNDSPVRLGHSVLGQHLMGQVIGVFGRGETEITVYPKSNSEYKELRNERSERRQELFDWIRLFINEATQIIFRVVAPHEVQTTRLGRSQLGSSNLSQSLGSSGITNPEELYGLL